MTTPFQPTRNPGNPGESEMHHAQRMLARREALKYAPGLGWLQWNGVKWETGAESELMAEILHSAKADHELNPTAFTKRLCSGDGMTAIARIAQWLPGVRVDVSKLDTNLDWLHTAGITWDLRTGNGWPSKASELNTKAVAWEPAGDC